MVVDILSAKEPPRAARFFALRLLSFRMTLHISNLFGAMPDETVAWILTKGSEPCPKPASLELIRR